MIRYTALLFVTLAIPAWGACGGRPQIPEVVPVEDPGPTDSEITEEIFEECAIEGLGESLALLRSLGGLIDANVPPPAMNVSTIDVQTACINFVLDSDRNGSDDAVGSLCFVDPFGVPSFPFDPAQLGPLTDLQVLLANAPDGSAILLTLSRPGPLAISMSVRLLIVNGLLFDAGGRIDVVGTQDCTSSYLFSGVQPASLLGAYPNAIVSATVSGERGDLNGTISLNGTSEAAVSMVLDDGALSTYRLNLDTFELEPLEGESNEPPPDSP